MNQERIIAMDIGGANLKFADHRGRRWAETFEMWRRFDDLQNRLAVHAAGYDTVLVTMTGELADCFSTRRTGVRQIAAAALQKTAPTFFYGIGGRFSTIDDVADDPIRFAASNWHATATAWSKRIKDQTLLVDIGSTTTDVIRIGGGKVLETATDDRSRLASGGLVYVGDRRTPVCGLVDWLTDRGQRVACMNEFFATIDDVRLLLGYVEPEPANVDTANSAPRTRRGAATRMLRMIGSDLDDHTIEQAVVLAAEVHRRATKMIRRAIESHRCKVLLLIGDAEDLIDVPDVQVIRPGTGGPTDPCSAMLDLWRGDGGQSWQSR